MHRKTTTMCAAALACLALAAGCSGTGMAEGADGGPADDGADGGAGDADAGREIPPGCGDGVLATDEQCEGFELRGATCESLGYEMGTLTCNAFCQLAAHEDCWTPFDGEATGPEPCDGEDVRGATCASLGLGEVGTVRCIFGDLDTSGCGACVIGDDEGCAANEICFRGIEPNVFGDLAPPKFGQNGTCTEIAEGEACLLFDKDDQQFVGCSAPLVCAREHGAYRCKRTCTADVFGGACPEDETCVPAAPNPDVVFGDVDGACVALGDEGGQCPCTPGLYCIADMCHLPCDLEAPDPDAGCSIAAPSCEPVTVAEDEFVGACF